MRLLSVFVLVLGGVTFAGGVPAASADPFTCQGQVATVVGTPGGRADGTPGSDVIVSNGAISVAAGAGRDVICVTRDPSVPASGSVDVRAGNGDDKLEIAPDAQQRVEAHMGDGTDIARVGRLLSGTGPRSISGGPDPREIDELYLDGLPFAEPGPTDIVVDTSKRRATFAGQAPIAFSGFEVVRALGLDRAVMKGSVRDDYLLGSACHLTMLGSAGNDHLINDSNRDGLVCNDTPTAKLMGEDGNDTLVGSYFADYIDGGAGNDVLSASKGNDTLYGRAGADELVGKSGDDVLYGGKGADRMRGIDGSDRLIGGRGDDRADGGGYGDGGSDSASIDTCKAEHKKRCER